MGISQTNCLARKAAAASAIGAGRQEEAEITRRHLDTATERDGDPK